MKCNELNQVTSLDLAHLGRRGLNVGGRVPINSVLHIAAKLPGLEVRHVLLCGYTKDTADDY